MSHRHHVRVGSMLAGVVTLPNIKPPRIPRRDPEADEFIPAFADPDALPARPDCLRESRCRRAARRQGGRLIRRIGTDSYLLWDASGATYADLTLEECELRLFGTIDHRA